MQGISICIYHIVFVMEMLQLHPRNIRTRIKIIGNTSDVFVMVFSSLRETDTSMLNKTLAIVDTMCRMTLSDRCCTC